MGGSLGTGAVESTPGIPIIHFGTPYPEGKAELVREELTDNPELVHHPSHYTAHPSGIEAMDIVKYESFLRGNVIKYLFRAPFKGEELTDLRKAAEYLRLEIERVEALYE